MEWIYMVCLFGETADVLDISLRTAHARGALHGCRAGIISSWQSEVIIGFSFRKSIKMGPIRLNLSKSGVGISTGVKGLRVSTGPRGTYLNAGRRGLYYRTKLDPKRLKSKPVLR